MTCIMGREAAYSRPEGHLGHDDELASWTCCRRSFDYKDEVPGPPLPVPGVYKFA